MVAVKEKQYANHVMLSLNQEEIDGLQSIFSKIGIADWVDKNRFSNLTFSHSVPLNNDFVNGWYDYQTSEAHVATKRSNKEFNQKLLWGKVEALSHTGRTLFEATQFTLLHELGHHIHAKLRDHDLQMFGQTMRPIRSDAVSNYAKIERPIEYFAETFVAWVLYRVELSVHDELGYGIIQRALKTLGIEVIEYDFNQKPINAN
jgi:hypothetical protein